MNIILVGASANKEKFGYKIFLHLLLKYKNVIPINPTTLQIEGIPCVSSISKIQSGFDIVVFVVKPEITLQILVENYMILSGKKLWFQPGSYNQEIIDYCQKNQFYFQAKNCILKTDIDFI